MKKNVDAERIRAAFKATQGIVEHSFEQHVIDASQADVNAMIERIASGESSFEEEDEVLMMKWRAMNALQNKSCSESLTCAVWVIKKMFYNNRINAK